MSYIIFFPIFNLSYKNFPTSLYQAFLQIPVVWRTHLQHAVVTSSSRFVHTISCCDHVNCTRLIMLTLDDRMNVIGQIRRAPIFHWLEYCTCDENTARILHCCIQNYRSNLAWYKVYFKEIFLCFIELWNCGTIWKWLIVFFHPLQVRLVIILG